MLPLPLQFCSSVAPLALGVLMESRASDFSKDRGTSQSGDAGAAVDGSIGASGAGGAGVATRVAATSWGTSLLASTGSAGVAGVPAAAAVGGSMGASGGGGAVVATRVAATSWGTSLLASTGSAGVASVPAAGAGGAAVATRVAATSWGTSLLASTGSAGVAGAAAAAVGGSMGASGAGGVAVASTVGGRCLLPSGCVFGLTSCVSRRVSDKWGGVCCVSAIMHSCAAGDMNVGSGLTKTGWGCWLFAPPTVVWTGGPWILVEQAPGSSLCCFCCGDACDCMHWRSLLAAPPKLRSMISSTKNKISQTLYGKYIGICGYVYLARVW